MANITDAQAINFCNTKARPLYDNFLQLYHTAQAFLDIWGAGNYAALIPNDATALVMDGSGPTGDGRLQLTAADINILVANAQTVVSFFTANSNARLNQVTKGAVNGQGRY
jgi:hypothetical protein